MSFIDDSCAVEKVGDKSKEICSAVAEEGCTIIYYYYNNTSLHNLQALNYGKASVRAQLAYFSRIFILAYIEAPIFPKTMLYKIIWDIVLVYLLSVIRVQLTESTLSRNVIHTVPMIITISQD